MEENKKKNLTRDTVVTAARAHTSSLLQVDMVFEVRDARIPFTSANDDLDRIVGPSKARLIVLNKVRSCAIQGGGTVYKPRGVSAYL